jgi:putative Mg2+ transporter-C (MgtC) family protein
MPHLYIFRKQLLNMNFELVPEELIQISLATLVGAIIGAEREYRNKSAGFRTVMLITLGSTIFTILSKKIAPDNPDRIAANILTGLGFLGAGTLFREDNKMTGLTTAATIWATAALGMAIGSGHYVLAIGGMLLVMMILFVFTYVEPYIDKRNRVRKYKIVCVYKQQTLHHYEKMFEHLGLHHIRGIQSRIGDEIVGNWIVSGAETQHEHLVNKLLNDKDVKEFDF